MTGGHASGRISRDEAAVRVVAIIRTAALRPVAPDDLPEAIGVDDLAVVCWTALVE